MITGQLTPESLNTLKYILQTTPECTVLERQKLRSKAPGVADSSYFVKGKHKVINYTLKDIKLNKYLTELTGEPSEDLITIHKATYFKGPGNKEHVDFSDCTLVIMLDHNCIGGDFIFNKNLIEFRNTGQYLIYNGGKELHSVTEITQGSREVLVVWYRKTSKLI